MSENFIATIKLAEGQVGFYDPLSRIHLTIGNPIAYVHSGTNCAQLRRSVKSGRIRLLDGTLGAEVAPFKVVKVGNKYKLASNKEEEMKPIVADAVVAPAVQEIAPEPVVEQAPEPVVEEKVEEPAVETVSEEESVKEEAPKKKASKKKSKKAEE